jgi:hypothetical protein
MQIKFMNGSIWSQPILTLNSEYFALPNDTMNYYAISVDNSNITFYMNDKRLANTIVI